MTNQSNIPDDLVKHLPKQTPLWALGLTVVLVGFGSVFGSLYLLTRDEVRQYLTGHFEVQEKEVATSGTTIGSILALVKSNSEGIAALSKENGALSERVNALERELTKSAQALLGCEEALKICNKGKS